MISRIINLIILLAITTIMNSCKEKGPESFAYGNFESEDVLVPSEGSGIVTEFFITQGDLLKAGERIAQIDSLQLHLKKTQLLASRKAILARLEQINSQIDIEKVNLENLQRELKRFGNLFLEEAATRKQMDDLEGNIELVKAKIEALKTQKKAIYAERDAQEAQISRVTDQIKRTSVIMPINGRVLETFVRKGEMVVAGRPVAKVADLEELILRVFIDGNQLSSLITGEQVQVFDDGQDQVLNTKGKVIWISPEAEFTPKIIQTREERVNLVYAVKVLVPNDGSLKVGMPAEIQLNGE